MEISYVQTTVHDLIICLSVFDLVLDLALTFFNLHFSFCIGLPLPFYFSYRTSST